MKFCTQRDAQKIEWCKNWKKKRSICLKRKISDNWKSNVLSYKNDGNGTGEIFQSLLQVFTMSHHLVKRHFLYLECQMQWNWMQYHFSCMKKMWLVSKESYFVDFSPVLYMVKDKVLVFLPDCNNRRDLYRLYWQSYCVFIDTIINISKKVPVFNLFRHHCWLILMLGIWKMC